MTNYTTTRVEQNLKSALTSRSLRRWRSRERAWAWSRLPACFGLGWQKEDTHLLALHEPVRHELPRSDPASLVGHVDSLAMLLPLSSLKVLAALRSSTRSLPRSQLACWGKLPELFFWLSSKRLNMGFLLFYPDQRAHQHFGGGGPKCWCFRNVGIWKCSSGNFFWKRHGNLCPVLVSRQNQCTPSRAPRRETYSRGSPIWSFSRARKTPSFGGKKLSTQNHIHLLPLERPRQRDRESDVT